MQDIFKNAERMAANSDADVLWLSERDSKRGGDMLCVAPLQVWGPLRDRLLSDKTVVLTSATLMLGGDFTSVATSLGLKPSERVDHSLSEAPAERAEDDDALPWRGIDVGSPFDYGRQAILYVARHLPPPGRDGLGTPQLDEIADLVDAADGRTLGLFSSRRAAEAAAEALRERLPHLTILAQGEAQLPELARLFTEDPHACLFGTLSLWQGLDVPGDTCQLVVIDRVPFPRPDDPLMSARQRAADQAGRQRVHAGGRDPRRAAAGPGRRPADPHHQRQGRGRDPRPAGRDRAVRQLPAGVAAADVVHHGPRRRPPGAATSGLLTSCDTSSTARRWRPGHPTYWEDVRHGEQLRRQ